MSEKKPNSKNWQKRERARIKKAQQNEALQGADEHSDKPEPVSAPNATGKSSVPSSSSTALKANTTYDSQTEGVDASSQPSSAHSTLLSVRPNTATTSAPADRGSGAQHSGPAARDPQPPASSNTSNDKVPPEFDDSQIAEVHNQHTRLAVDHKRGVEKGLMKTNNFRVKVDPMNDGSPRIVFQYLITKIERERKTDENADQKLDGRAQQAADNADESEVKKGKRPDSSSVPVPSSTHGASSAGGQPGNDPSSSTTQTNDPPPMRAHVRRRVAYLLLRHLRLCHTDLAIASDLKDTLIASARLEPSHVDHGLRIDFYGEDEDSPRADCPTYQVSIGEAKEIPVGRMQQYFIGASASTAPADHTTVDVINDVEKALNIILSQRANDNTIRRPGAEPTVAFDGDKKYYNIAERWQYLENVRDGTQTLRPNEDGHSWNLQAGLMALPGYVRSAHGVLQPSNPFILTVNTKTGSFYLGARAKKITLQQLINRYYDETRPVKPNWEQTEAFIKGLRVMTTYLESSPASKKSNGSRPVRERIFTVSGFPFTDPPNKSDHWDRLRRTPRADQVEFDYEGRNISVQNYFQLKHSIDISPFLTDETSATGVYTVRIGTKNFQPATKLEVLPGQVYRKRNQVITQGCRSPRDNYDFLTRLGRPMFDLATGFVQRFGISLDRETMDVNYNVLQRPGVRYRGNQPVIYSPTWELQLKNGDQYRPRAFIRGPGDAATWSLVQLHSGPARNANDMNGFRETMQTALNGCGLNGLTFDSLQFNPRDHLISSNNDDGVHKGLTKWYNSRANVKLLVVLLTDRTRYSAVKRWGDQTAGVATICVLEKSRKGGAPRWPTDGSVFRNLCLKFNPKACSKSVNHILASRSALLTDDTMLVGLDVVSTVSKLLLSSLN